MFDFNISVIVNSNDITEKLSKEKNNNGEANENEKEEVK